MNRNRIWVVLLLVSAVLLGSDGSVCLSQGQDVSGVIVSTERQENQFIVHVRRPDDFKVLLMPAIFDRFGKLMPGLSRESVQTLLGKPRSGTEESETYWQSSGQYIISFDPAGISTSITMILPDSHANATEIFNRELLNLISKPKSGTRMTLLSESNGSREEISCVLAGQTLRMLIWQKQPVK
ncbi:MAG TPA: hypothetical protein VFC63_25055 [Blastocatellia bacterium]|nr:hypothetical protein [Blastocatellia bacterium]